MGTHSKIVVETTTSATNQKNKKHQSD